MAAKPHVVVFPFPTQGHINPLSLLADQLIASDIDISFVITSRTYSMLQKCRNNEEIRNSNTNSIRFEVIPDGLPPVDQNQPVSPSVVLFMNSIPLMQQKLEELLRRLADEGRPAACIIADSFLPWVQDVANALSIPRIEFWTSSVTVYAMGYHVPELISKGCLPVKPDAHMDMVIATIPGFGPCKLADFFYDMAVYPVTSPIFNFLKDAFQRGKEAQRIIVHSIDDLEKDIVHALRNEGLPVDAIGPLLSSSNNKKLISTSLISEDKASLEWLDKQEKASVIYASFGSNVKISVEAIREIALGLEDSKQPFLLVIRPDLIPGQSIKDILPESFQSITEGRSRISSWVPQIDVLSHPAVGGFFSHLGWNSTLEAIWMGVPLLGCHRESEQNTNMKCLLDWNLCVPVDKGKNSVEPKRDLVAKAIHTLMHTEEGKRVRERMLETRTKVRKGMESGHSRSSLNKLAEDIKEMSLGKRPNFLAA